MRPSAGGKLASNGEAQQSYEDARGRAGRREGTDSALASIQAWIEKHLRRKVNVAKSGTGRVWERKIPGFRLNRKLQIGIAPESLARLKAKVRGLWRSDSGSRWLVPLAVFLCLFGLVLVLATTVEALAPFIYAIF